MDTATKTRPRASSLERFKVRFPDQESLQAALSAEKQPAAVAMVSDKRRFIAVELEPSSRSAKPRHEQLQELNFYEKEYHAELVPDIQYSWENSWGEFGEPEFAEDDKEEATLDDVLHAIRARDAWNMSRGANVAIAIVDSGIDGSRPEFQSSRRLTQIGFQADPWVDDRGHGTMCACIAAASRDSGGEFEGVAPEAGLISCRTRYFSSELTNIYDFLSDQSSRLAMPIVANNSWGIRTDTPPVEDPDVVSAITDAVEAGVILVFSAGNYHLLVGNPGECSPNSIWTHKSLSHAITVATCKLDQQLWDYSSRGPGQWFGRAECNHKPDVTAPTPANGRVLFGGQSRVLRNGWGTSGAAPQVTGLAALMLALNPGLGFFRVFDTIRATAQDLGLPATCQGTGLINCQAAVDLTNAG
jgi:serine protease AprX